MTRSSAIVLCILLAAPAGASVLDAGATDRVALDVPKDASITAIAALGAILAVPFTDRLAPASCRWCDGAVGTPVNPVDDWFHSRLTGALFSRSTSDAFSSYFAYGVVPAVALAGALFATGPHATDGAGLRATFIVAESVAVSGALMQAMKFSFGRQRPYVHFQKGTPNGSSGGEENLSFPSGHAATAAAAGTSAAMVATLEESPAAPWLWAAAAVLTVTTGTLRMMSESHYFTDVLGGIAVGAGSGILMPLLHRRGSWLGGSAAPSVAAMDGTASFRFSGRF
jgi:membrane-associated phospholipid phosphatase